MTFIEFIKSVENPSMVGRDYEGVWYPHTSPEGGNPTVGYGHKITDHELGTKYINNINFSGGVSDLEIEDILESDICNSRRTAKYIFTNAGYFWEDLDENRQDMLTEMAFNLGHTLVKFKKFLKAVHENDVDAMKLESTRSYSDATGKRHLLTRRNEAFNKHFFN